MVSRHALIVLFAATLLACQEADERRRPVGDYAVYAAAIDSLVARADGHQRVVLVSPTVGDRPEGTASVEQMRDDADVPADVRADFMAKNAQRIALFAERLRVAIPVTVVPRDSIAHLSDHPGEYWKVFRAKFPGARGVVRVSRVGFSRDSTRALLYLQHTCGDQCGTGWKLQLRRGADGTWSIFIAEPVWFT